MEVEERQALEWYSRLITSAEVTAGNRRAMKKPGEYQQYVFNKFASHPDHLKSVLQQYQEACTKDELDKPLWSARLAAKGAAMGREV